jgi:PucR C-terminal helix-turn-helix domain
MSIAPDTRATLSDALAERMPALLEEVRLGLRDGWPDYADFLDRDQDGVAEAARLFVDRLFDVPGLDQTASTPRAGDETLHLVFEQLGRRQLQLGSDLTRLLTAFQFGSRVAWKHVSAVALECHFRPEDLAALADAVFGFVNKLSFAAARGYVLEQVDDARARERNREELARLLLSGRASAQAVRVAAHRAGWRVPDTAAVVLTDPDDAARHALDRLGPETLRFVEGERHGAIVPESSDRGGRAHLRRLLQGARAVVGSVVTLDLLPRSADVALIAARLRREGRLDGDPVFADEHLDTIIVWRDAGLVVGLRGQVLAPLDELGGHTRDRLVETLRCWLKHQGDRGRVADELAIHPQTVRYRLAQLREIFGDELDDPGSRARLFLALQWGG